MQCSIKYKGVIISNSIPSDKRKTTFRKFKINYKDRLIANAELSWIFVSLDKALYDNYLCFGGFEQAANSIDKNSKNPARVIIAMNGVQIVNS